MDHLVPFVHMRNCTRPMHFCKAHI